MQSSKWVCFVIVFIFYKYCDSFSSVHDIIINDVWNESRVSWWENYFAVVKLSGVLNTHPMGGIQILK